MGYFRCTNQLLVLAECIILYEEEFNTAANGCRFNRCLTKHSAFHVKPSCSKGEARTNVSTNKLIQGKQGFIRTENSITSSKDRQTTITFKK